MGLIHSSLTALDSQQLEDYQNCTFFTKKEILHVHQRFLSLKREDNKSDKVSMAELLELPEFKVRFPAKHTSASSSFSWIIAATLVPM